MALTCTQCDRDAAYRDMCWTHYKKWLSDTPPEARPPQQKQGRKPGPSAKTMKEPILDVLQTQGGWWTMHDICKTLGVNDRWMYRHLHALVEEGAVTHRKVERRTGRGGDWRSEWKAVGSPISGAWKERSACKTADPTWFFQEIHGGPTSKAWRLTELALSFCEACPVRLECGTERARLGAVGVWGGQRWTETPSHPPRLDRRFAA